MRQFPHSIIQIQSQNTQSIKEFESQKLDINLKGQIEYFPMLENNNIFLQSKRLSEKGNQIQSQVYPNIFFRLNADQDFLFFDYSIPSNHKPIRSKDLQRNYYYMATLKIFQQISGSLSPKDIWICQTESSIHPISVYFTQSKYLPIVDCCRKVVFIEFQTEEFGSVRCTKCRKIGFSFAGLKEIGRKYKHSKQVSKTENSQHKDSNVENTNNEKVFKQCKMRNQSKKQNVRKLISSCKHRQKSIKNFLAGSGGAHTKAHSAKVHQVDKMGEKDQNIKNSEIGDFLIQLDFDERNVDLLKKKEAKQRIQLEKQKQQERMKTLTHSQFLETKLIIQDLFS